MKPLSFLSGMRLTSRFLLLGAIAFVMVALPTALYFQTLFGDMRAARQESQATTAVLALNGMIQTLQKHRGLSAAAQAGNTALAQQLPTLRDATRRLMSSTDSALTALSAGPALRTQWKQIQQGWAEIERRGTDGDAAATFDAHTALVRRALVVNDELLAESGFARDPDPGVHALIQTALVTLPQLGERLGIMRALGVRFLQEQAIDAEGRSTLRDGVMRVRQLQEGAQQGLRRVAAADAASASALAGPVQSAMHEIDAALALIDTALLRSARPDHAPADYFQTLSHTIDTVGIFNTAALARINAALNARTAQAEQRLLWLALALLAGLLVANALALLTIRSIIVPIRQAIRAAAAVSRGDLTVAIPAHGNNEMGRLMGELERMRQSLRQLVMQMSDSSDQVAIASSELAHNSHSLSERSISQAAALEETAASMEELTVTVKHNADHAQQANQLSGTSEDVATRSGHAVAQVARTMEGLNDSARQIVDIVDLIDGIAFQTNILALNASVEAARAGVQGRGFAVVATEVRALAQRSAAAAREIKELIDSSVTAIGAGHRQASDAGATMDETVTSIRDVSRIMSEITLASAEQSIGISQVNEAMIHMEQVTQQNVTLVEEVDSAAASLREQAEELARLVARFQLEPDAARRGAAEANAAAPGAAANALTGGLRPIALQAP